MSRWTFFRRLSWTLHPKKHSRVLQSEEYHQPSLRASLYISYKRIHVAHHAPQYFTTLKKKKIMSFIIIVMCISETWLVWKRNNEIVFFFYYKEFALKTKKGNDVEMNAAHTIKPNESRLYVAQWFYSVYIHIYMIYVQINIVDTTFNECIQLNCAKCYVAPSQ